MSPKEAAALSDENIKKFQALYKQRFGKDLTQEEAYTKGMKLLGLMKAVYRPMKAVDLEAVRVRQAELSQKHIDERKTRNNLSQKK